MAGQRAGRRGVRQLVKEFKADRVKNANVIVDIRHRLQSSDPGTTLAALTGLHQVFLYLLNERAIHRVHKGRGEDDVRNQVNKFYIDMYEDTLKDFLNLLNHRESAVQELSLSSVVQLMQAEALHPFKNTSKGGYGFPFKRLKALLAVLLSCTEEQHKLVNLLQEYLECDDFLYYTLLGVTELVQAHKHTHTDTQTHTHTDTHTDTPTCPTFTSNLLSVLEKLKIPPPGARPPPTPPRLFLLPPQQDSEEPPTPPFSPPYPECRRCLNLVWGAVVGGALTPDQYRRVLVTLPDLALPHLSKPLALTGFFMEAYNLGGAISLLALQGVFILINKHDLDYPEFYKKLYALLQPSVFGAKYRARFFMLCDRFLSSTHLPEYLVAAFVKRLARLALTAPSPCLHLTLHLIQNLLIRYPGLQKLIHNPSAPTDMTSDPYDPSEVDPEKCRAGGSSLWEVASLYTHAHPYIGRAAGFTRHPSLPQRESDLGVWVEQGYVELFERSTRGGVKEGVATTFTRPQGLLAHPEDTMAQHWCLAP